MGKMKSLHVVNIAIKGLPSMDVMQPFFSEVVGRHFVLMSAKPSVAS